VASIYNNGKKGKIMSSWSRYFCVKNENIERRNICKYQSVF